MKSCLAATILLVAMVVGCAAHKPALVLPSRGITAGAFAGSTLSGPVARPVDLASGLWRVEVRPFVTDGTLPPGTASIGPGVKLILVTRGREPMQPSTDLTWAVRLRDNLGDTPAETLMGSSQRFLAVPPPSQSALAKDTCATFTVDTGSEGQYLSLQFNRSDKTDEYDLAIVRDGQVVDRDQRPVASTQPLKDVPEPSPVLRLQREIAILPRTLDHGRDHFLLTAPIDYADSSARQVVFDIDVQAVPKPPVTTEMGQALVASAKQAGDEAAARSASRPAGSAEERMFSAALQSLAAGGEPRAAIAYLANQSGATGCESTALVADRRVLDLLGHNILDTAQKLPGRDRNSVRWILERSTYLLLAQLAEVESPPCPAELLSILTTQAGEVGAHPDAVRGMIKEATGPDDLANRLIAENRIFLEDSSPASRVRAYDWLRARSLAPDGFDPLGTPRDRRTALNKANNAK